ncbi:MAG TPA: N-acetyl-gamma-glutamyl-phosphate reductase [Gammaproteobacteria bacterium]|nr:N-acetyl-gamma-glutamyl-phosphate reductase [Gammaproteobacteria bacterium]
MSGIDVCILGGSGYGGGELLRLLSQHPQVKTLRAVSRKHGGEPFWKVHPNLRNILDGKFDAAPDWATLAAVDQPVVFSAMPHFELAQQWQELEVAWTRHGLKQRLTVIDLSGDFRLDDAGQFKAAYGKPHPCPQALRDFVYGLPEWRREHIVGAKRIANPGCFATAIQLALLPLTGLEGLGLIAVTGVTGSSGSGATPSETTHHPVRAHDFRAYKVLSHQHTAEITNLLERTGTTDCNLAFVPHSAPLVRGIFVTVQLRLPASLTPAGLRERYTRTYSDSSFVRLVEDTPRIAAVTGSNFCELSVHERDGNVVVMTALDNLVKGMAGQAVQNMNIALGFEERESLKAPGFYPG